MKLLFSFFVYLTKFKIRLIILFTYFFILHVQKINLQKKDAMMQYQVWLKESVYLLGPSYIDLRQRFYFTVLGVSTQKKTFFNENNVPQVLLFLPEQSPSHDHQHFYIHLLSRQSV